jgi:hypothetical protein
MVVENVEVTINDETTHGWFEAKSVKDDLRRDDLTRSHGAPVLANMSRTCRPSNHPIGARKPSGNAAVVVRRLARPPPRNEAPVRERDASGGDVLALCVSSPRREFRKALEECRGAGCRVGWKLGRPSPLEVAGLLWCQRVGPGPIPPR